MQIIKLELKGRSYDIVVGNNILKLLGNYVSKLNIGNDAYIITNASVKHIYGRLLARILQQSDFGLKFKMVSDSEKSKSIETATSIIKDIAKYDRRKRIFIIALGGGVIGDLAGFVASIYKRGIPYIQIPTTLLAQVDSSIGGKTAVDLTEGKNLIGAFYQPKIVFSDVSVLRTLDSRQILSGLAEVIKYGVIKDRKLFQYLEMEYKNIVNLKQAVLESIVQRSTRIKASIVKKDEREERGLRTILNFGHTIGHAIEAAGSYKKYNHGEAVALGMLVASDIGKELGLTGKKTVQRIEDLIEAVGLPTKLKSILLNDIIEAHYRDKKFIGPENRFVLLKDIGKTKVVKNIPIKIIRQALKKRI